MNIRKMGHSIMADRTHIVLVDSVGEEEFSRCTFSEGNSELRKINLELHIGMSG